MVVQRTPGKRLNFFFFFRKELLVVSVVKILTSIQQLIQDCQFYFNELKSLEGEVASKNSRLRNCIWSYFLDIN